MNINQVAADLEMVGCSVRDLSITNNLISIRDDDELHLDLDIYPVYEGIIEQEHRGRVILNLYIDAARKEREDQKTRQGQEQEVQRAGSDGYPDTAAGE